MLMEWEPLLTRIRASEGLFRKKAPGMKKEVGYIILCQCYSFVWEITFEAYTEKKRRMIEGSGASH